MNGSTLPAEPALLHDPEYSIMVSEVGDDDDSDGDTLCGSPSHPLSQRLGEALETAAGLHNMSVIPQLAKHAKDLEEMGIVLESWLQQIDDPTILDHDLQAFSKELQKQLSFVERTKTAGQAVTVTVMEDIDAKCRWLCSKFGKFKEIAKPTPNPDAESPISNKRRRKG